MRASVEGNAHEEGKLISSCQIVNYLLVSYATDDVIAESEADITNYKKPKICRPCAIHIHCEKKNSDVNKFKESPNSMVSSLKDYTNRSVFL